MTKELTRIGQELDGHDRRPGGRRKCLCVDEPTGDAPKVWTAISSYRQDEASDDRRLCKGTRNRRYWNMI